jgi:hypothetical protein
VQPWWDPVQAAFLATPIISSIQAKLEAAYAERQTEHWAVRASAAIAKAAEYDADAVWTEHWLPYLATVQARYAKPPRRERRQRRKLKVVA